MHGFTSHLFFSSPLRFFFYDLADSQGIAICYYKELYILLSIMGESRAKLGLLLPFYSSLPSVLKTLALLGDIVRVYINEFLMPI